MLEVSLSLIAMTIPDDNPDDVPYGDCNDNPDYVPDGYCDDNS